MTKALKPRQRRKRSDTTDKMRRAPRRKTGTRPRPPYRSLFEERLALMLKDHKAGARYEDEKLSYTIDGNYLPDWTLPNNVILEAKGVLDAENKRKLLAVKRAHPDRVICLIFQRASNKFNKKSATTYGDWAERNGFLWSDGVPNPEWFKLPKTKR